MRGDLHLQLHIYGSGVDLENLRMKIKTMKMTNIVKIHGFDSNVINKLSRANVCCFPSHSKEGLMSSVLEAMYYNGVVITTTNNGSESVIDNNISRFLVEPKNIELLANKINSVIELSGVELQQVKENSKNAILTKCSWELFTKNFIEGVNQ